MTDDASMRPRMAEVRKTFPTASTQQVRTGEGCDVPRGLSEYLSRVYSMLQEAVNSNDLRVKIAALRILERQGRHDPRTRVEHWSDGS